MEIQQSTRDHIIKIIDAFQKRHRMSDRQIGMAVFGDNKFMSQLRDAEFGVTLTRIQRVEEFMNNYEAEHGKDVGASGSEAA